VTPSYSTVPIANLAHRRAYSLAADGDSGAALVACLGVNGRLSAHRVDAQGNDAWTTMGAHDITGLSTHMMAGLSDYFFFHSVAIVPNGSRGALVMYQDITTSANSVASGLFYSCIDANGGITKRGTIASAGAPAHMLAEPTGQGSALVAWRDRSVSMADTDAFVTPSFHAPGPTRRIRLLWIPWCAAAGQHSWRGCTRRFDDARHAAS
jgi:hypothetical protein